MKTLINADFKAIRTGDFVTADGSCGEFIFDNNATKLLSVALMLDIGKSNNIPLRKEKAIDVAEKLASGISNLELPTMDKQTDSEIVKDIVVAGHAAEKSDDDMLLEIMQAGVKFKVAGKLFNKAMQDGGFKITATARKDNARKILVDAEFNPESYDEVSKMVEKLIAEISDTTTSQAYSCIKNYAKEMEFELPKPPKVEKGGLRNKVLDWICANPDCTKDDILTAIKELSDGKKGDDKMAERFYSFVEFGKKYVAGIAKIEQESAEA